MGTQKNRLNETVLENQNTWKRTGKKTFTTTHSKSCKLIIHHIDDLKRVIISYGASLINIIKNVFCILAFAKALCDTVLQPETRRVEGCNTFSHKGLANVNIWKRMVYPHCYIPSFPAYAFTEH